MENATRSPRSRSILWRWCTRGAGTLGVLFIVLMIVIVVRTFGFQSRQLEVLEADVVKPMEGFEERLAGAIQFRTVSKKEGQEFDPAPFEALHAHLIDSFPNAHETLDREVFGEYSLLYRWPGIDSARRPILLMSHLDVVPVEEGADDSWTYPPFSGDIAEGFIWGRGALDVKCGAVGLMEAVERLLVDGFRPESDIYLAFGHDEETGGQEGNRRIAEELGRRGVRFRFVLDEGGGLTEGIIGGIDAPVAFVGIAEKGYATVDLSAVGPEGHSSMPPPQTSVGRVCSAIDRLEQPSVPRPN